MVHAQIRGRRSTPNLRNSRGAGVSTGTVRDDGRSLMHCDGRMLTGRIGAFLFGRSLPAGGGVDPVRAPIQEEDRCAIVDGSTPRRKARPQ